MGVIIMSNQSIFELQLPEELLPFLDKINGNSINKKVRVAFAINLFAQKQSPWKRLQSFQVRH